MHLLMLIL